MNIKKISICIALLVLTYPSHTFAKTGYIYVHEGDLFDSYSLVERLDSLYSGELWLVETGIGCSMWMQEGKTLVFDTGYSSFLDGISDKIIVPEKYFPKSCKIWDAFPISDYEFELFGFEKDRFLSAIAYLDLSTKYTTTSYTNTNYTNTSYTNTSSNNKSPSTTNSCPKNSSPSVGDRTSCSCNVGYSPNNDKTACTKNSSKQNDKICKASFGKNSIWNKQYNTEGSPLCGCKNKFTWNSKQTACIKAK